MGVSWDSNTLTLTFTGTGTFEKDSQHPEATTIIVKGYDRIGNKAFYNRANLKVLQVDDSVSFIDNHLFSGTKVSTFHIPLHLSNISQSQPFDQNDYLKSFTIDPNHATYAVRDGILYSRDFTQIICYPGGKTDVAFTIPRYVSSVFNAAIGQNNYLKHLIVHSSVTDVEGLGYKNSLKTLTIFRCGDDGLEDVACEDKSLCGITSQTKLYWMRTNFEYELSSDSKTLTVYPSYCPKYSQMNNISFTGFTFENENIENIVLKKGITSLTTTDLSSFTNLKNVYFLGNKNNSFLTSKLCNTTLLFISFLLN